MKYMDIFTDAVSYFTNIPPEFIKGYLKTYSIANGNKGDLLDYIMDIEFPEIEAIVLLHDLKSGDLESTIRFFNNSFDIIRTEELRQALVN
jgi:hypothetical protein